MQLALNIALQEEATLSSFCWSNNNLLYNQLTKSILDKETEEKRFFIHGPTGTGKSHILQALVTHEDLNGNSAIYLPLRQVKESGAAILEGLETITLVCLDDLDAIAGDKSWEEALFYFYNRIKDENNALILSANASVQALGINMPDLLSRLCWEYVFALKELDDTKKIEILQDKAQKRGLALPETVASFLITRHSRNMGDLVALLNKLDRASLAARRRLTIPFVKSHLV